MAVDSPRRFHEVPIALWERMDLVILLYQKSYKKGRPHLAMRDVVGGILYALATGCQ